MLTKTLLFYLSFFALLLISQRMLAQTVLNSTGNSIQNNEFNIEYSIGEINIITLSNNQDHVTQGLLQPVLRFDDCNLLRFIPNAFTPNGDRLNDCFKINSANFLVSFELSVYNRWGELVFKTNKVLECWDGHLKGKPQPTGTYVYIISGRTKTCGTLTSKGTITLIR